MAEKTDNYGFSTPGLDGAANIEVQDNNWNKADKILSEKANTADVALKTDIGDLSDLTISNMDSLVAAINYLEDKKVKKISGKILSSNDFTSWYKSKIDGLDSSLAATYATIADVGSISSLNTSAKTVVGAINEVRTTANDKAPAYSYSTTDLTAGSSSLTTGKLYFVYE